MTLTAFRGARRAAALVAGLVLIGVATPAAGAPASVTGPTVCVDYAIKTDVAGDLVVPAHHWCLVKNIVVHGSVRVGRFSRMYLQQVSVQGDVDVPAASTVEVELGSRVAGSIHLTHAELAEVRSSEVSGGIDGTLWLPPSGPYAALSLGNATIGGAVDVAGTTQGGSYYFALNAVTIGGDVRLARLQAGSYGPTRIGGSLVLDALRPYLFTNNRASICGMQVSGNATVENTAVDVDWSSSDCPANITSGSLFVRDNTAVVRVGGSVGGDLVCRDNAHHPRRQRSGTHTLALTIAGRSLGQCAQIT